MFDDLRNWTNYSPQAWPAEVKRVHEIVGDAARAQELLLFGFRPLGLLDEIPSAHSGNSYYRPYEVTTELSDQPVLVDIFTGYRFRFLSDIRELAFDLIGSNNYIDGQELLMLAAHRQKEIRFDSYQMLTYFSPNEGYTGEPYYFQPVTLHVRSVGALSDTLERLTNLFCRVGGAPRLWFRGQPREYQLQRSRSLTQQFYGTSSQPSLLPSAGRFAHKNPDKLGFNLVFSGPNHYWKKPFLIWMMRENEHWFLSDPRALHKLSEVLADDNDMSFTRVMTSMDGTSLSPYLNDITWPDEADDLRQWFFAFMKTEPFAITLQQYGYVTSLLDLTSDLNVALYFSQSEFVDRRIQKQPPKAGRLVYVFAERHTSEFFRDGNDLFWGEEGWVKHQPPRLKRQQAGFIRGSTCRTQNFYNNMIVAKIYLEDDSIQTTLSDQDLFPDVENDLLYRTFKDSRPVLDDLY